MQYSNINKISEQVQRQLDGGDIATESKFDKREIALLVEQTANKYIKASIYEGLKIEGEFNISGSSVVSFSGITITKESSRSYTINITNCSTLIKLVTCTANANIKVNDEINSSARFTTGTYITSIYSYDISGKVTGFYVSILPTQSSTFAFDSLNTYLSIAIIPVKYIQLPLNRGVYNVYWNAVGDVMKGDEYTGLCAPIQQGGHRFFNIRNAPVMQGQVPYEVSDNKIVFHENISVTRGGTPTITIDLVVAAAADGINLTISPDLESQIIAECYAFLATRGRPDMINDSNQAK